MKRTLLVLTLALLLSSPLSVRAASEEQANENNPGGASFTATEEVVNELSPANFFFGAGETLLVLLVSGF
jgi:hypothetical protein